MEEIVPVTEAEVEDEVVELTEVVRVLDPAN